MIKDLNNLVKDYSESVKMAKKVYLQTKKYLEDTYNVNSSMYKKLMNEALNVYNEAKTELKKNAEEKLQSQFSNIRKEVSDRVLAPQSKELLDLLPMLKDGKIQGKTIDMILEKYGSTYMNDLAIHDAISKPFKNSESLSEHIDQLENSVNRFIDTYEGQDITAMSYQNAVLLNGAPFGYLEQEFNEFVTHYSTEGGDNM